MNDQETESELDGPRVRMPRRPPDMVLDECQYCTGGWVGRPSLEESIEEMRNRIQTLVDNSETMDLLHDVLVLVEFPWRAQHAISRGRICRCIAVPDVEGEYQLPKDGFILYRLWDAEERLLYIGMSCKAVSRLRAHQRTQQWGDSIARVTWEVLPTHQELVEAERQAIQQEHPKFNKAHVER